MMRSGASVLQTLVPLCCVDSQKPKVLLAPGDSVIVVRGQLKNLEGTVRSVNVAANTFVLKVRAIHASQIGTTDDLEMPITEVKKVFQVGGGMPLWLWVVASVFRCCGVAVYLHVPHCCCAAQPGNHVKVVSGSYIGETGTVVISSALDPTKEDGEFIAVVLLDSGVKEIQCFVNDLQVTRRVTVAASVGSMFHLRECVFCS